MPNLVKEYSVFEADQYRNLMPQLRSAGLRPLNMADVMREKLEALSNKDLNLAAFWLDRYFDTVDGIAYSNGKRKVAYNPKQLVNIESNVDLSNGALIITPDEYKNSQGEEFSVKELENAGLGRRLSKEEVTTHPFWLALARGDKHLLREYRDVVFAEIKRRYDGNEGMGVYLGSEQQQPSMRALFVGDLYYMSDALGSNDLSLNARLVGVRSRVAEGDAQNLMVFNPQDVEKARQAVRTLEQILK